MIGDIIDEVLEVLDDTEDLGNTSSNHQNIRTHAYPADVGSGAHHPAGLHTSGSQEFDETGTFVKFLVLYDPSNIVLTKLIS